MKTTRRKFYYIVAILSLIVTLSSCEYVGLGIEFGNGPGDYRETTDYLCSRTWTDEWTDDYGIYYYQELRFYPDNTGIDYLYSEEDKPIQPTKCVRLRLQSAQATQHPSSYTSLRLNYGSRYSYMDNIQMGGNQLNCLLDNYPAYFIGK